MDQKKVPKVTYEEEVVERNEAVASTADEVASAVGEMVPASAAAAPPPRPHSRRDTPRKVLRVLQMTEFEDTDGGVHRTAV